MRLVEIKLRNNELTQDQLDRLNTFFDNKLKFLNFFEEFVKDKTYESDITKIPKEDLEKFQLLYDDYKTSTEPKKYQGHWQSALVDLDLFVGVCYDINFEYIKTIRTLDSDHERILEKSKELDLNVLTAIGRLEEVNKNFNTAIQTFNSKVKVHIGGSLLLAINEVTVEEDFCTEALQRKLNDGWRILAVCVQPDGRRPDYILGRTKDDF